MTHNDTDSSLPPVKGSPPVMFCQTAEEGGSSKQLVRGSTPSTRFRPRKEKRRLTKLMFFRCTPEDNDTIRANAARAGLEISTYMRLQSTGKPIIKAYRRIRVDWQELKNCLGAINRAGNVVNQFVKMLRIAGGNSEAANAAFADLSAAAHAILRLLPRNGGRN